MIKWDLTEFMYNEALYEDELNSLAKRYNIKESERKYLLYLVYKAAYFDCLNKALTIRERDTGKLVGKFMTQREAGVAIGMSQSQVSLYLNGYIKNKKYTFTNEKFIDVERLVDQDESKD